MFRFVGRFFLLPWLRVNVSRSGPSVSVGPRGATLTTGFSGTRMTIGVPGTGLFLTKQIALRQTPAPPPWMPIVEKIHASFQDDQRLSLVEMEEIIALRQSLGLTDQQLPPELVAILKNLETNLGVPKNRFALELVEFMKQYVCHRHRANSLCTNDLRLPVDDMNEAVLTAIEAVALTPEAVESVIQLSERHDSAERHAALVRERADVMKRLERLVTAIETGGDVASLTARMKELEQRRTSIESELSAAQPVPRLPAAMVEDRLAEWRRLLRQSTTQARAVIQRLVCGRIVFAPEVGGTSYTFEAPTRYDKLFSGLVVPRAVWKAKPGRGTERLTPEDVYGPDPVADADYGVLLEGAASRVKCSTSPTGVVPEWTRPVPGEVPAGSGKAA